MLLSDNVTYQFVLSSVVSKHLLLTLSVCVYCWINKKMFIFHSLKKRKKNHSKSAYCCSTKSVLNALSFTTKYNFQKKNEKYESF